MLVKPATFLIGDPNRFCLVGENRGDKLVKWQKDLVVARATKASLDFKSFLADTRVNDNIFQIKHLKFSEIIVGDINDTDTFKLISLLKEMSCCFSVNDKDFWLTNLGEMKIELTTDKPVYYRPYRLSQVERSKVKDKVKTLIEGGVIRESESEYASPIVLIPQKNYHWWKIS